VTKCRSRSIFVAFCVQLIVLSRSLHLSRSSRHFCESDGHALAVFATEGVPPVAQANDGSSSHGGRLALGRSGLAAFARSVRRRPSARARNDPTLLAKSDPAPPASTCHICRSTRKIMPNCKHRRRPGPASVIDRTFHRSVDIYDRSSRSGSLLPSAEAKDEPARSHHFAPVFSNIAGADTGSGTARSEASASSRRGGEWMKVSRCLRKARERIRLGFVRSERSKHSPWFREQHLPPCPSAPGMLGLLPRCR
jgi:hypothetical protein